MGNYYQPEIETMPVEQILALQSERLIKQVRYVYDHVKFYHDKMDEIGVMPDDIHGVEDLHKLPFITKDDFNWAVETASKKKKLDCSSAEFLTIDEGLCVQIMHHGSYDDEPATIALMDAYLEQNGYENDMTGGRLHHEIYLSDPRKTAAEKQKTVIRHPIKKIP